MLPSASSGDPLGVPSADEAVPLPYVPQDAAALRRELRQLRRGKEVLALRVKRAKRELARARRRQRESERRLLESEAAVAVLSRRLGCASEGLPEIDEWRELARSHTVREKELRKQIEDETAAHEACMADLRQELDKGGRPNTAKATEARAASDARIAADARLGTLQAVHAYLSGELEDISLEDLRELVRPQPLAEGSDAAELEELSVDAGEYVGVMEAACQELQERWQGFLRDLLQLSNSVGGRKDALLKALAHNVLARGLEDIKLCTPAERNSLRELLQDAESVCAMRLAGVDREDEEEEYPEGEFF